MISEYVRIKNDKKKNMRKFAENEQNPLLNPTVDNTMQISRLGHVYTL